MKRVLIAVEPIAKPVLNFEGENMSIDTMDWFRWGSDVGRWIIIGARRHGSQLQRYTCFDRKGLKTGIITCAKPDRALWEAPFKLLANARMNLAIGPLVLGYGVTDDGVFYVVEEAVPVDEKWAQNPMHAASTVAFLYAAGAQLAEGAEAGFAHGALHPDETLCISNGEPVIFGIGIRQILGCTDGAGVLDSRFTAPEILHGLPWDERADVFSLCSIVGSFWRGPRAEERFKSQLGVIGDTIREGQEADVDARPCWAVFNPVMEHWMGQIVQTWSDPERETKRDATFIHELKEAWEDARESEQPTTKASSDTKHINAKDRLVPRAGQELFEGWTFDTKDLVKVENIEATVCKPSGADDVDLLRRTQLSPEITLTAGKARVTEWMRKRWQVEHSNIPALVSGGVRDDGWAYWVEEGTDTKSFRDWVKRPKKALARRIRAVKAVVLCADALGECACVGVYHGDLVPDRDLLLSTVHDTPLVFGIGALQGFGLERSPTQNPYAAPERRAGEAFDHRADIYALGAILCEALTGRAPRGDGVIRGLDRRDPFDRSLWQIISRAISRDPSDRFEKWVDFLDELESCLQNLDARRLTPAASVAMPHTVPPTAAAQTPTSSSNPSSNDPTPRPAPPGLPTGNTTPANDSADLGPNAARGDDLSKALESVDLDRVTLPCVPFPATPQNNTARAVWMASTFGLVAGLAASIALLWSRVPELNSMADIPHDPPAFDAPMVWHPVNTAEPIRAPETKGIGFPRAQVPQALSRGNGGPTSETKNTTSCRLGFCVHGREEPVEPR